MLCSGNDHFCLHSNSVQAHLHFNFYSYLKMLRESGPVERIFKEMQEIRELNFKYQEEPQPMDNVENLSENMQLYPPELIIAGPELILEYDPQVISDCISRLRSDNVCLFFTSRDFTCNQVEKWFKTNYSVEDIPAEWEERFKNLEVYPDFFSLSYFLI